MRRTFNIRTHPSGILTFLSPTCQMSNGKYSVYCKTCLRINVYKMLNWSKKRLITYLNCDSCNRINHGAAFNSHYISEGDWLTKNDWMQVNVTNTRNNNIHIISMWVLLCAIFDNFQQANYLIWMKNLKPEMVIY